MIEVRLSIGAFRISVFDYLPTGLTYEIFDVDEYIYMVGF